MFKIPFLSKFTTDDQQFYDSNVNEELKYCSSKDFMIRFMGLGKNRRIFVINTRDGRNIIIPFKKFDYEGINKALEKIKLNLALAEKEKSLNSSDVSIMLGTTSKKEIKVDGPNGENETANISTINQLLIDNKPLREPDIIIRRLLELAMRKREDNEEPYLDFSEAGYDRGLQNYLIMSLYEYDIFLNDELVNALVFYKMKEPKFYFLINSLMRGNFDEISNYLNSVDSSITITDIVIDIAKIIRRFIEAQEKLPPRKYDLMLYRLGLGVNKDKTVGAQNIYEGFTSFGTSGGILVEQGSEDTKPVLYKRILKKEEQAIPIDIIENLGVVYKGGKYENEFLLPPFVFKVTGVSQEDDVDVLDIEETEKINPRELLEQRLDELEQYLIEHNEIGQCEKLRRSRRKKDRKVKKRIIRGYNIKDVYSGLRPKRRIPSKTDEIEER